MESVLSSKGGHGHSSAAGATPCFQCLCPPAYQLLFCPPVASPNPPHQVPLPQLSTITSSVELTFWTSWM